MKDAPTWGETIAVSWTVTNQGSDTALGRWYDGFYLSSNATLDSSDIFITSRQVSTTESPLTAGASYTATQNITLPSGYTDKPYLLAVTDYYNNYQREWNESNNTKVIATLDLPDLVVSGAQVKDAPTWGETIAVSWTVTNQGPRVALGQWYDGFYLSSDAVFDSSDVYVSDRLVSTTESPLALLCQLHRQQKHHPTSYFH